MWWYRKSILLFYSNLLLWQLSLPAKPAFIPSNVDNSKSWSSFTVPYLLKIPLFHHCHPENQVSSTGIPAGHTQTNIGTITLFFISMIIHDDYQIQSFLYIFSKPVWFYFKQRRHLHSLSIHAVFYFFTYPSMLSKNSWVHIFSMTYCLLFYFMVLVFILS